MQFIVVVKRVTGGKAFHYIKWYVCVHCFSSELQQDFLGAVAHASRQLGKPVIEDRILNQILYYLPQLYELDPGSPEGAGGKNVKLQKWATSFPEFPVLDKGRRDLYVDRDLLFLTLCLFSILNFLGNYLEIDHFIYRH